MSDYAEVFSRLTYETAAIVFFKKNSEIRVMLGTRNLSTVGLLYGFQGQVLGGHDKRCNINNGNLAVYDLVLGDARSFNIDRLIDIQYGGIVETKEQYDKLLESFVKFRDEYEASKAQDTDLFHRTDKVEGIVLGEDASKKVNEAFSLNGQNNLGGGSIQ